jgi:replication factor A1
MIDSNEFFDKIVSAWENRRSKCKELDIECRAKTGGRAIFLITTDYTVVAQFPIPEYILKEATPLKEFAYIIEREKLALMKKRSMNEKRHSKIKDLKAGMKRINLKARVLAISKPQVALTRYNDYVMFANATLTDETGTIKLTLWNNRTNMLSINNIVEIENANVAAYRGELQLRMGRNSKLEVTENYDLTLSQKPEIIRNLNG